LTHFGNDGRTLSEHDTQPIWKQNDTGGPVAFKTTALNTPRVLSHSPSKPTLPPVLYVSFLPGSVNAQTEQGPETLEVDRIISHGGSTVMLTKKQLQLLEFINDRMHKDGVPPSFDEMKEALDLRSKSGIHRLITALEERGFIRRLAHRARAIEIVKLPESLGGQPTAPTVAGFEPRVIEGDRPNSPPPAQAMDVAVAAFNLPIMGKIAAGVPIEAVEDGAINIAVPGSMLSGRGNHYALEVKGESMIDAGINDGDIVVIRETSQASNGDIVVAMVEGYETTLKRYKRTGDMVALEAANPAFETRIFTADKIEVQGKLVGLIRSY
jgi:repressor LexA